MLESRDPAPELLAAALGWPPDTVDAARTELLGLGLVRPSWDDPAVLRAVPPQVGLELVLRRRRADLERRRLELEQGRIVAETLVAEHAHRRGGTGVAGLVEELVGADAVREAFERIVHETTDRLSVFVTADARAAEGFAVNRSYHRRVLERGVELRVVYLASMRNEPAGADHLRWMADAGAQVRTAPLLPMPLVLADRQRVVVPLDPGRADGGACVLHSAGAAAAMSELFDHHWRRAARWDAATASPVERARTPAHDLSAPERALIRLLADGDIDEQIARKMGVSKRTVGRMVSAVMARLGARSRFQAGAIAAARGWLDESERDAA